MNKPVDDVREVLKSKFSMKSWLNTKDSDEVVGTRLLPTDCPISNFLNQSVSSSNTEIVTGAELVYISTNSYQDWSVRMPSWAKKFRHLVDMHDENEITATTALGFLSS